MRVDRAELERRAERAERIAREACVLCARRCGVPRAEGFCGVAESHVYSEMLHHGEERCLVPSNAVFLAGCNARCVFCQAHVAHDPDHGAVRSPEILARRIESRRVQGARNVNFVGGEPTLHLPYILRALSQVAGPLHVVWNSNAWLSPESLALLDGVVDTYLFDWKFGNDECAWEVAGLPGYMATLAENVRIARSNGHLLVRHLVLPGHIECCTRPALTRLSAVAPDAMLSLMVHYYPSHRASGELGRELTEEEVGRAQDVARELGFALAR